MNVIYMPIYRRAEFLHVALECLTKNPEYKDFKFLFHVDFGYSGEVMDVIKSFDIDHEHKHNPPHRYKNKLVPNIMNGYKWACGVTDQYVIMVEPDVFVSDDFLRWHTEIHKLEPDIFCSIATKNNNLEKDKELSGKADEYYFSQFTYQSLGVCFDKRILESYITPHANRLYYKDLIGYVTGKFPNSQLNRIYSEQAGLIRRVQEQRPNHPIVYPHKPRAFHGGFRGKNRGVKISGWELHPLEWRIKKVKEIAFDINVLKKFVKEPQYIRDSMPVPLTGNVWDKLIYTP